MRRALHFSVGQTLGAGLGVVALVLLLVAGVAVHAFDASETAQARYHELIEPRAQAAAELERSVLYVAIALRRYLAAPGADRLEGYRRASEAAASAQQALAALRREPDGQDLWASLDPLVARYLAEAARLAAAVDAGSRDLAAEPVLGETREEALAAVRAFHGLQERKLHAALDLIGAARARARLTLIAGFLVAFGLLAVAGWLTIRAVRRPFRDLVAVSAALERGDWKPALAHVPVAGAGDGPRNELLLVARALGRAASALQRREERLAADGQIAAAAAGSLDRDAVAAAALQVILGHLGAEIGAVYVTDEGTATLRPIASAALDGLLAPLAIGEGIPGRAARERRLVLVRDLPADTPLRVKLGVAEAAPRALAAVPIVFGPDLEGVLLAGSLRDLDGEALAFLSAAALQLGVGLKNARAHARIRSLAADLQRKHELVEAQAEEIRDQLDQLQAQSEEIQAQSEELQAQNEELHNQGEELKVRNESLEESDARKNEFLGVLAHELRNPLAAIVASLYVLARSPSSDEAGRRALKVIDRQTGYLKRLIDDLLDVARVSRGKVRVRREPLDLCEVVRASIEDARAAIDGKPLALELHLPGAPVVVDGDRTRLSQIIGNLLGNAVKFTDAGGKVAVTVGVEGERVLLRVADSGVGLTPELRRVLFRPFSQAETSIDREDCGLGLGLALVKGLVELHGGSVEALSDGPGKGTEVVVTLPHSRKIGASASPPAAGRGGTAPRRVLIIDDNADAASSLREVIELHDHEVVVATSGREGLVKARTFRPDIVFCDIGLPEQDGYAVVRALRSDEVLRSTKVVAVTGYATPEDRQRAADAGFDEHLAKPPDLDRVLELLGAGAAPS